MMTVYRFPVSKAILNPAEKLTFSIIIAMLIALRREVLS